MEEKPRDAPPPPASSEAQPPAETLAEAPRRRAGSQKRKAVAAPAAASSAPTKRLAKERNPYNLPPPVHSGPLTRARQTPGKLAAVAGGGLLKAPEHGGILEPAGGGAGKGVLGTGDPIEVEDDEMVQAQEPLVDAEFDAVRSRGANAHVVPTHAGWFSWKKIHPLEKHALPSFFNGKSESRTPKIYLEIRNAIMKKFHSNPQIQVEPKDFSNISFGDIDARREVMDFLDHWGLINFHPFPPSAADASIPDAEAEAKSNSLLEKLYQFETIQSCPRYAPKKQNVSVPAVLTNLIPEPTLADDLMRPEGPSVEYHCNSCSADCSRKRYHCQKQADFDLCSECYNNGKFGSDMAPADFILMEPGEIPGASGGSWTDQETLLLLEALELFGENWNEIAEHVATKTKAQCILHFLQMPIEDPFLEGDDEIDDNTQEHLDQVVKESATQSHCEEKTTKNVDDKDKSDSPAVDIKPKDDDKSEISSESGANIAIDVLKTAFQAVGYFPDGGSASFAEAGNPVMALAAFLAGLVGPDNTTSIRSSLKAMTEESPSIQLATRHCFRLEDPPNDDKELPAFESISLTKTSCEAPKQEGQVSPSEEKGEIKDCNNKEEVNKLSLEKDSSNTLKSTESTQKEAVATEVEDLPLPTMETTANINKGSDSIPFPQEQVATAVKDTVVSALSGLPAQTDGLQREVSPTSEGETKGQESGALSLVEAAQICSDASKVADSLQSQECLHKIRDADSMPISAILNGKATEEVAPSSSTVDSGEKEDTIQLQECSQKSKNPVTLPASATLEGQVSKEVSACVSAVEIGEKQGEEDKKEAPSNGEKTSDLAVTDNGHNINRLKRAAITVLSAAAVKAKLLAKEEEDHIQQLVSLLIEKQLHKLEIKLSFLTEIESAIMRMREQMDRARQKLLHERAQIIAARLGLPPNRVNPQSLPTNRVAMNHVAASLKPQNMAFQKPPFMRRP